MHPGQSCQPNGRFNIGRKRWSSDPGFPRIGWAAGHPKSQTVKPARVCVIRTQIGSMAGRSMMQIGNWVYMWCFVVLSP